MKLTQYPIGLRLAIGFGFMALVMLVLTAVGITRVIRIDSGLTSINEVNSVKQRHAINFRGSVHDRAIELRDVVLVDGARDVARAEAMIEQLAGFYADSAGPLDALVLGAASPDAEEVRLLEAIKAVEQRTLPLAESVRQLRNAGDREGARALLLAEAKPAFEDWLAAINAFIDLQEAKSQAEGEVVAGIAKGFATTMILLCLASLLGGSWVAYAITRSVTRPLGGAVRLAEQVRAGDLDGDVRIDGRDETARLLAAMVAMRSQLVEFTRAQGELAARHEAGDIDHRIDASAMPGVYGRMAADINALADQHLGTLSQAIGLMGAYAVGDFGQDMPALPGRKAEVTEAMCTTKANLTAVSEAVKQLASSAASGDFAARGDAGRFQYVYRGMVEDLNALMGTAETNLGEISRIFAGLAEGDLTVRMAGDYPGVFGRIRDDAHQALGRLEGMVGLIKANAGRIRTASEEIAAGNADLSRRTERQAASLEEAAASMEELTSAVRMNSDNAQQADTLAKGGGEVAREGSAVVGQVVSTMEEIADASRRIGEIIGVIDGIAFQTNILALNAAVEAARAGEQGRGFAVVASEVRSLAQRSAEAAKDIKALIEDSRGKVERGSRLVEQAGATMADILASVQRVGDLMGDIAGASNEQGQGIAQVNASIGQIEEVTQHNAGLVEQASASAHELASQAEALADAVAVFVVSEEDESEGSHGQALSLRSPTLLRSSRALSPAA